ncbi:MAG: NAD(+)/NADH kinase [Aquabacterium sp.]
MPGKVAIIANPMSGRDVRRLAARASNMTHEAKRDLVARVATGLDALGVDEIMVLKEPYRVSSGALEMLPLRASVRLLDVGVTNSAADTVAAVHAARAAGADVIVTLGGDGTNRVVARTWPDVPLVPLSTGTNNVFPVLTEATSAGVAAGLIATGAIAVDEAARRCKLVHARSRGWHDIGVIDAVLLRPDHIGNRLPFDPNRLAALVLTRAEPSAVGMSPIGGYLDPIGFDDDCGLALRCGADGGAGDAGVTLHVPISPGLFRDVRVASHARVAFGDSVEFVGPGGHRLRRRSRTRTGRR